MCILCVFLFQCVLAAIIVVALKGMFKQFSELKRLWNISIIDFVSHFFSICLPLSLYFSYFVVKLSYILLELYPIWSLLGFVWENLLTFDLCKLTK